MHVSESVRRVAYPIHRNATHEAYLDLMTLPFSLVMSVYHGDRPEHFREAVDSLLRQTVAPLEIVLVADGPLSGELEEAAFNYGKNPLVRLLRLKENVGRGAARHQGVLASRAPIVAI